uniref:Uncharacterized protein n=1 Tax=Solibacter usitatus (strain Ellin6076) TaxID=234267 RepID=Q01TT3_SOLUE
MDIAALLEVLAARRVVGGDLARTELDAAHSASRFRLSANNNAERKSAAAARPQNSAGSSTQRAAPLWWSLRWFKDIPFGKRAEKKPRKVCFMHGFQPVMMIFRCPPSTPAGFAFCITPLEFVEGPAVRTRRAFSVVVRPGCTPRARFSARALSWRPAVERSNRNGG